MQHSPYTQHRVVLGPLCVALSPSAPHCACLSAPDHITVTPLANLQGRPCQAKGHDRPHDTAQYRVPTCRVSFRHVPMNHSEQYSTIRYARRVWAIADGLGEACLVQTMPPPPPPGQTKASSSCIDAHAKGSCEQARPAGELCERRQRSINNAATRHLWEGKRGCAVDRAGWEQRRVGTTTSSEGGGPGAV